MRKGQPKADPTLESIHQYDQWRPKTAGVFSSGDRVFITNEITHVDPSIGPVIEDYLAFVTHVKGLCVTIHTYTGVNTWRAPKNLRHQSKLEFENFFIARLGHFGDPFDGTHPQSDKTMYYDVEHANESG